MSAPFTPEQEARLREIVREEAEGAASTHASVAVYRSNLAVDRARHASCGCRSEDASQKSQSNGGPVA